MYVYLCMCQVRTQPYKSENESQFAKGYACMYSECGQQRGTADRIDAVKRHLCQTFYGTSRRITERKTRRSV